MNKHNNLLMLIAGDERDLIFVTEIIPKVRNVVISSSRLAILGYFCCSNFDPESNQSSGIRGICI